LMVSGVRFPSFKKRSHQPHASHWTTLGLLVMLSVLVILRERFFLPFFALYLLVTLVLNAGWKLGWRGVEPPMRPRKPEPETAED
jgi:CDP-diacylglycerol---serine O-phosphatidyltransferase